MTVPEIVKAGPMPVGVRAAALASLLVSGALHALMPDLWGWVLVLMVASALVGAASTIIGAMTMVGTVTISELSNGAGVTLVDEVECQGASWFWILGWVVPGLAGITVQWQRWTAILLPEPL